MSTKADTTRELPTHPGPLRGMPAPRRDNSAVRFDPLAWSGDRWDFLTNIILAIVAVVLVSTFTDYPITYDEEAKAYHGDLVRVWIASGFSDQRVFDFDNLNLYGSFFDLIASVSRLLVGDYLGRQEASHLLIAAFGFLGVFATARVGRLAAGPMVGCLSCLLLIFTPQFYGHLFSNPKDMPFAALTMASTCNFVMSVWIISMRSFISLFPEAIT